jgi:hypothetical protein
MAVEAIGGISSTSYTAPVSGSAPPEAVRRAEAQSKDSTVVISRVTRTRDDGSTVTTITYADGHTRIETTPPKFSATEDQDATVGAPEADGPEPDEGRVTAVDILA